MDAKVKKVKAIELIMDWSLWPRYEAKELDSTNLKRMKEALRVGVNLPPIVVNERDYRVVDGFHRITAVLDLYGDDAEIDAILKKYESNAEMFLESVALNAQHGLPLSPRDRAHAILRARRLKIPYATIAHVLGTDPEELKKFIEKRVAISKETGEKIVLSGGATIFGGQEVDKDQEHYIKTANGNVPMMHASMLINALKARGSFTLNEKSIKILTSLRNLIDNILSEVLA